MDWSTFLVQQHKHWPTVPHQAVLLINLFYMNADDKRHTTSTECQWERLNCVFYLTVNIASRKEAEKLECASHTCYQMMAIMHNVVCQQKEVKYVYFTYFTHQCAHRSANVDACSFYMYTMLLDVSTWTMNQWQLHCWGGQSGNFSQTLTLGLVRKQITQSGIKPCLPPIHK